MALVSCSSEASFRCKELLFVLVVIVVAGAFATAETLGHVAVLVFGQDSSPNVLKVPISKT